MASSPRSRRRAAAWLVALSLATRASAPTTATLTLRGQPQTLHLYGQSGGQPLVVSSGDGGWLHLAPQVSAFLATRGFFVVGFDSKAYLESFTSTAGTLKVSDASEEPWVTSDT